jgi:hypothetical protein
LFADRIDYHKDVGQLRHLDYPVQVAPELCRLAIKGSQFLLAHLFVFGRFLNLLDIFQPANALSDGGEISQCAAQPTLIHVKLAASQRSLFYRFLGLLLATDE